MIHLCVRDQIAPRDLVQGVAPGSHAELDLNVRVYRGAGSLATSTTDNVSRISRQRTEDQESGTASSCCRRPLWVLLPNTQNPGAQTSSGTILYSAPTSPTRPPGRLRMR
jgi:hypothetical protein